MSLVRLWPAALLLVSGCVLASGRCTYELRNMEFVGTLTGSALPPGSPPAEVSVLLAEMRNGGTFRILSAYVTTQAAVAISLVQLRRATPNGPVVLATWPLGNGQSGTWGANLDLVGDTLPRGALRTLAHLNLLNVYVQIGVQGNLGELAGNLKVRSETDWEHPYCD